MEVGLKEFVKIRETFENNYKNFAFWLDLKSHLTQVYLILELPCVHASVWVAAGTLLISRIPQGLERAQDYGARAKRLDVWVPTPRLPEGRTSSRLPHASCWALFQHQDHWICVYRWPGPKMAKSSFTAVDHSGIGLILPGLRHRANEIKGTLHGAHSTRREEHSEGHHRQIRARLHGPFSAKILWSHQILPWNPQDLAFRPFKHII